MCNLTLRVECRADGNPRSCEVELHSLVSGIPHAHLVMCPVFGRPAAAEAAGLVLVMAGDYKSKMEVAPLLVPAMGRKVIDLGENLEKGKISSI